MSDSRSVIRDPKPAVERIEVLAARIKDGDIILPKFQREFVWDKAQIRDLLDSIAKNYPIGSVLLWLSRQRLESERKIADLSINERDLEYPVNYLLDGQQRLSSICGALFWNGTDPSSEWNIAYDLVEQQFIHLDSLQDPPLHQIRLNKLSHPSAYFQHIASLDTLSRDDKSELRKRANLLFDRFKDYTIATVTLSDMPLESVAPIFERINSTGTRLTIVDLMRAATWSPEFDLIESIDGDVLDAVNEKGFGGIERKAVLRNLSASAGGGFSVESIDELRKLSPDQLRDAAEATVKAYKLATDFLVDEIGIPNASILPYANQIVILAELWRNIQSANANQLLAIKRWFWRSTFSGYFSGWNTGQMASDLETTRSFSRGDIPELDFGFIQPTQSVWQNRQFRANNAHSKMLALILSNNHPKDFLTGQRISLERALSWTNTREYHHIFPQAYLKRIGQDPKKINCIANFMLLTANSNRIISDQKPSDYVSRAVDELGDEFQNISESNLLSETAIECLLADDFENFIVERSQTLQRVAQKLCGWA